MSPIVETLAKELAEHMSQVVHLPFINAQEEETFFQFVITKVFELSVGHLLKLLSIGKAGQ